MRICMLAYAYYESDTRILQYVNALQQRGDSVEVISLRQAGQPPKGTVDGATVFRVQERIINEASRFTYLIRLILFFFRAARTIGHRHFVAPYDIVHVHNVPDFLVFAAILPKLLGARVILDIHDILPEFYASKFRVGHDSRIFKLLVLVERASTAFADHVIIANHLWLERLRGRAVPSRKCTAICNYPDPRVFFAKPKASHTGEGPLIIYPGTLNRHQGLDVAVRAFKHVVAKIPTARFEIHGEGPDKPALQRLAGELGLEGRVSFHPFVSIDRIAPIMASADLAVVPKRASSPFGNEAASTKIMEFMALGIPLVASRTKIDTYYFTDDQIKFCESENERDLADAIVTVWRNVKLREQLVANAIQYVRHNNWEVKKKDYLNIVDGLAAVGPGGEPSIQSSTGMSTADH